jgi:hypothetical protein
VANCYDNPLRLANEIDAALAKHGLAKDRHLITSIKFFEGELRLIAECLRCVGPQKVAKQPRGSTDGMATREKLRNTLSSLSNHMGRETSWICPDVGVNGRSSVDFVMLNAADRHSLRASFLTPTKRGASILKMMDVSRHRSVDTLPMCETPSFSRIMPARGCSDASVPPRRHALIV